MPYYFCIVGTRDNLLYEADLSARPAPAAPAAAPSAEPARSSGIFGFSTAFGTWTAPHAKSPTPSTGGALSSPAPDEGRGAAALADEHHVLQMIAHGSLDVLEDKQFVDSSV